MCTIERLSLTNEPFSLLPGTNIWGPFWFIVNKNTLSRSHNIHSVKSNIQLLILKLILSTFFSGHCLLWKHFLQDTSLSGFSSYASCWFFSIYMISLMSSQNLRTFHNSFAISVTNPSQLHYLVTFMYEKFPNIYLFITSESYIQLPS